MLPLFLYVIVLFGCGDNYRRIICKDHGFSIQLPEGWVVKKGHQGTVLLAAIPDGSSYSIIHQNINVVIEAINDSMSLEEYIDGQIALLKKLRGFLIKNRGYTVITGKQWPWFTYEYTILDTVYSAIVLVNKKNGRVFVITGIAEKKEFATFRKIFLDTARSFRFL